MKRVLAIILSILLSIQMANVILPLEAAAEENQEEIQETQERETAAEIEVSAPSAILMEASTGQILFEKDAHEKMAPASMTKIMTLLLVAEAISDNRISLDQEVTASEYAVSMGGSQVYLEANSKYKISELIKAVGIGSANDASVVLAEVVGGTVENFVAMMNNKAKELGLTDTNFKNPHGLDEANHYSTAYDMAMIASELVKYDFILDVTSTYEDHFTHPNGNSIWLVNTNSLIRFYDGVDGLKTGFTTEAGYCLTATKKVDDMRILTVTMNAETKDDRNSDTIKLMESAFSMYNVKKVIDKNNSLGKTFVNKSTQKYVNYYLEDDAKLLLTKDTRDIKYDYKINHTYLQLLSHEDYFL